MNSVSRYLIPKPKKSGFSFQSLIVSSLAMHVIFSASRLVTVSFLHPIFRPASPPECSKNEGLFKIAANAPKRRLFKIQPSAPKFLSVEEALVDKYMEQRKQGKRVCALWFKKQQRNLQENKYLNDLKPPKIGSFYFFVITIWFSEKKRTPKYVLWNKLNLLSQLFTETSTYSFQRRKIFFPRTIQKTRI